MGRIGDKYLAASIALRLMPCADQQNPGKLAMRTSRRLQRDRIHASDFYQAALQQIDNIKLPLS